jgi:hypothetical protein
VQIEDGADVGVPSVRRLRAGSVTIGLIFRVMTSAESDR